MRRGQCLCHGGNRHLREGQRNRFVLKKAAGSTHVIFIWGWFVFSLQSACGRRCRFSSFNTFKHKQHSFFFHLDFWPWLKFKFAFLFNYVIFTDLDSILYYIFGCLGCGRLFCSYLPAAWWHGGIWIFVRWLRFKTASSFCSPSRIPPYSTAKPHPSKGGILIRFHVKSVSWKHHKLEFACLPLARVIQHMVLNRLIWQISVPSCSAFVTEREHERMKR